MLTKDFQENIPLTNWMYPVNKNVKRPDSFKYAPEPDTVLNLNADEIEKNTTKWLKEWEQVITE